MHVFKERVFQACEEILKTKLEETTQAISDIRESMGAETRSSAGDKHETARARMQAEEVQLLVKQDQQRCQLDEIKRLRNFEVAGMIGPASLVETDKGFFLIALSLGKIMVDNIS